MRIECVIVGGGAAGLAMSRALVDRGIHHVVLERSRIGDTWRTQRWDSFRLNTPSWMNAMLGPMNPGAFCSRDEVVQRLTHIAASLPVREQSPVDALSATGSGFSLETPSEEICSKAVVFANGILNVPWRPQFAREFSARLLQMDAGDFRSAERLPAGSVLVVGGGQSGCQIAEDLALAGRRVFLATCSIGRFNWTYRGRETFRWLDDLGFWSQRPGDLDIPSVMRDATPLVASGGRTLSLPMLAAAGVRLLGRLTRVQDDCITLEGSAADHAADGDAVWRRTTALIDAFISRHDLCAPANEADEGGGPVGSDAPTQLNLTEEDISTVLWCTGFRGDLSFTNLPLVDGDGRPVHDGSTCPVPGVWLQGYSLVDTAPLRHPLWLSARCRGDGERHLTLPSPALRTSAHKPRTIYAE